MYRTNQTPARWEHDHRFLFCRPSISFLHVMRRKKKTRRSNITKERSFEARISFEKTTEVIFIYGFHSIYRWKRSRTDCNSKFQSPKSQSTSRFSVNRISRRSTVVIKTRNPFSQFLCLLDSKRHRIRLQRNLADWCDSWKPVAQPAIKSRRFTFMIQILAFIKHQRH